MVNGPHAGIIHGAENSPDGLFTSPQEISKPGIDDDEAANIRATGSRGLVSDPLLVLGRWVWRALEGVTLSVI